MRKILPLSLTAALLAAALLGLGPTAQAAAPGEEEIYGNQLLTPDERSDYNARMQSLTTIEEREAYRLEHKRRMQDRAQKRGLQYDQRGVLNPYQSEGLSGAQ
ncbi:MAG: hypothetical protein R3310_13695 [Candidatus Competibacteraceae bacterium]|nr:hypothetical protein [Candidatus Competibacteraceae bacterium]